MPASEYDLLSVRVTMRFGSSASKRQAVPLREVGIGFVEDERRGLDRSGERDESVGGERPCPTASSDSERRSGSRRESAT